MHRRLFSVAVAAVLLFSGIAFRYFQVSKSGFSKVSVDQSTRIQTAAVARGTIYDRYGRPLVNDTSCVTASVVSTENVVRVLEDMMEKQERAALLKRLRTGERAVVTFERWLPPTEGVLQFEAPIRYGEDPLAVHLIGYINGDGNGVTGVEKGYHDILSSFIGKATVSYQTDALGRAVVSGNDTLTNTLSDAVGGVVLTLDAQIQRLVQEAASNYFERGAVIVTDADTSQVLASVSLPLYNPSNVESALGDEKAPLIDRTLLNYNCGSVFKIITAAAALENGYDVDTSYICNGMIQIGEHVFHCHNRLGDGAQTMVSAMANSCNCYFLQLAMDIGADALFDMASKAGLDEELTLCKGCVTAKSVLPSEQDLTADAALANFAIGQGDLLTTPCHIAALVGAVVNDGMWQCPTAFLGITTDGATISEDSSSKRTIRLFSPETAKALRLMLECVVKSGTGKVAAPAFSSAAGKTGTAQTGWEQDGEEVVQSWFAGYCPSLSPKYVITVLSENGGANGKSAAVLFRSVCDSLSRAGLL